MRSDCRRQSRRRMDFRVKSGHDAGEGCDRRPRGVAPSILQSNKEDFIMPFRIQGLPAETFAPLFALTDDALAQHGAVRQIADGPRPCRISLTDAKPGDELILVNYEHHAVASPYRMRFAIYVREDETTFDAVDTVPDQWRGRTLAVRAFDSGAMMVGCELVAGEKLEGAIARLF